MRQGKNNFFHFYKFLEYVLSAFLKLFAINMQVMDAQEIAIIISNHVFRKFYFIFWKLGNDNSNEYSI